MIPGSLPTASSLQFAAFARLDKASMVHFRRRRSPPPLMRALPELRRALMLAGVVALVLIMLPRRGPSAPGGTGSVSGAADADGGPWPMDRADLGPVAVASGSSREVIGLGNQLAGLPIAAFDAVRDDTPFRAAEVDAFYGTLNRLASASLVELASASRGAVSYRQLSQQPATYRGAVVRLEGTVRRAFQVKAPENPAGLAEYFQVWLVPPERTDPVVIFANRLPRGFPLGMDLEEPVLVDGVFFKRWAYNATDRPRSAPLLLADGLTWRPRPAATTAPWDLGAWKLNTWLPIIAGIAVVSFGLARWAWLAGGRRARTPFMHTARLTPGNAGVGTQASIAQTLAALDRGAAAMPSAEPDP